MRPLADLWLLWQLLTPQLPLKLSPKNLLLFLMYIEYYSFSRSLKIIVLYMIYMSVYPSIYLSIHSFIACDVFSQLALLLSPKTNTAAPYWPQERVIDPYKIQRPIEYFAVTREERPYISPNMEISGLQLIQSSEIDLVVNGKIDHFGFELYNWPQCCLSLKIGDFGGRSKTECFGLRRVVGV